MKITNIITVAFGIASIVVPAVGTAHAGSSGGMQCCGGQQIDTSIQFCCDDQAHDINKSSSSLSFDLSKYFKLIKNIADSIPEDEVEYTPPGETSVTAKTETHDQCCDDKVKTLVTTSKSITLGLGEIQGSFPVAGSIPGVASAGIRLKLGGSLEFAIDDKTDCDKSSVCGTTGFEGEGSFCVYASLLLGTIDIEGCGNGSPSVSADVCYDEDSGKYDLPNVTASMSVSLSYTVTALTWSHTGSLDVGTYSASTED